MIFPTSVSAYAERWNGLPSGTSMEQIGTSARTATTTKIRIRQETGLNIGCRVGRISCCEGSTVTVFISNLHAAAFQGEQAPRALLNEQNDQHQDRDFCQNRTPEWLNHFADHSQTHGADNGAG